MYLKYLRKQIALNTPNLSCLFILYTRSIVQYQQIDQSIVNRHVEIDKLKSDNRPLNAYKQFGKPNKPSNLQR